MEWDEIRKQHGILVWCAVVMFVDSSGPHKNLLHWAYRNIGMAINLTPKVKHETIIDWLDKRSLKELDLILTGGADNPKHYTKAQRKDPEMKREIKDVETRWKLLKAAPKGTSLFLNQMFDPSE